LLIYPSDIIILLGEKQMEKSMGGSNKELSKLCLAGFILTIMPRQKT